MVQHPALAALKRASVVLWPIAFLSYVQGTTVTTTVCTAFDKEPAAPFKFGGVSIDSPLDNKSRVLTFHNIGVVQGSPVDLRVAPLGKNEWRANDPKPSSLVLDNGIAKLDFACGFLSKVNLCFVPAGASKKSADLKVHKLAVSFYDMDGIDTSQAEIVKIGPIHDYTLPPDVQPQYTVKQNGDDVTFIATGAGTKKQKKNPKKSNYAGMTPDQRARSVTVHIADRNCFSLEVDTTSFKEIGRKNTRFIMITLQELVPYCGSGSTTTPIVPPPTATTTPLPTIMPGTTTAPFVPSSTTAVVPPPEATTTLPATTQGMTTATPVATTPPIASTTGHSVPTKTTSTTTEPGCAGFEREWRVCTNPVNCSSACIPKDCKFGSWGMWYDGGGCSQVVFRQRNIEEPNNDCGMPCEGPCTEAKRFHKLGCSIPRRDCELSDWSDWNGCVGGAGTQTSRKRIVIQEPSNGGEPCLGNNMSSLEETRPCSDVITNCELTMWHDWSPCSATCGVGTHTRFRRVLHDASYSGEACRATLKEVIWCMDEKCAGVDCQYGAWTTWTPCLNRQSQSFRKRQILSQASGDGLPCNGPLRQTKGCPPEGWKLVVPCLFSNWATWSACDRTCGGGQTKRTRKLISEPKNGGWCPPTTSLIEIAVCNAEVPCSDPGNRCMFADWSGWTPCDVQCGTGETFRTRGIAQFSTNGAPGCEGKMREANSCYGTACGRVDCRWQEWYDWSACTCSCDGGTRTRTRSVAETPRNGGKPCPPYAKTEVAPCNTQSCSVCINASWGVWSDWSECSATCSAGSQVRTRTIAQEANHCGYSVVGQREEYKSCVLAPCEPTRDCTVGQWGQWSSCSCSCFGNRERNRVITQFATPGGKECTDTELKQAAPCNPGVGEEGPPQCGFQPPVPCKLSLWNEWGSCSKTCGGGERQRTRKIVTYPAYGGQTCKGALSMVAECSVEDCPHEQCIDCEWSSWADWGACGHCGSQRYRVRHIAKMANFCGKQCDLGSAKQVSNCTSHCHPNFLCTWSEWTTSTGCGANSCGGSSLRSRSLSYREASTLSGDASSLFEGLEGAYCAGTQLYTETCDRSQCAPKCVPQNCLFAAWGEWTQKTCLGLCFRTRVVAQHNNHCGTPCVGDLEATRRCHTECSKPVDCMLSAWSGWSACDNPNSQRYRSRHIMQKPMNGGEECSAVLEATVGCGGIEVNDCVLSEWSLWEKCSTTCDAGYTTRARNISVAASGGGEPCTGHLEELQPCVGLPPCEGHTDCKVSDWSFWSECDANSMKRRDRHITQLAAGGGLACTDELKEVITCGRTKVDCSLTAWTDWDACDQDCSGQQQRHRQIHNFSKNGGKPCPSNIITEQRGCDKPGLGCGQIVDCAFSPWAAWTKCTLHIGATCGRGQQTRYRHITAYASGGGKGCDGLLAETTPCAANPCNTQNCTWVDWSHWTSCTKTCGGGYKERKRDISQMPQDGGAACSPFNKAQVEACNTQMCTNGTDGEWGDWGKWSGCSATCAAGIMFRVRKVAVEVVGDGRPPAGADRETKFCNQNISCVESEDCVFGAWDQWGACSATCTGVKKRHRFMVKPGKGKGKFCEGPLIMVAPCNPEEGQAIPPQCIPERPPVDCVVGTWAAWSQCSVTCGTGQHYRNREIKVYPAHGGKLCEKALKQIEPCSPPGQDDCALPTDCEYADWGDWGSCDKCEGQRERFRNITTYPLDGGKNCDPFDSSEVGKCPFTCNHDERFCVWMDWSEYHPCSKTCGEGRQFRERRLGYTTTPPSDDEPFEPKQRYELMQKYLRLKQHIEENDARDQRQVLSFFLLGFASISALFVGFKVFTRPNVDGEVSYRAVGNTSPTRQFSRDRQFESRELDFTGETPRSAQLLATACGPRSRQQMPSMVQIVSVNADDDEPLPHHDPLE